MKKAVSGIMLTLLLINILALAFSIQPVRAGTITTRESAESSSSFYDRQAAYDYGQRYWDKVCSDGYFWDSPSTYISLPTGTDIASMTGYDCAHFVSCCIGSESNEQGGGLNVPSRVLPTYGEPGAAGLGDWLISSGNGVEKTSITELAKGDVINYDWNGDSHWDHVALYLENGKVAAHTSCVWETDWQLGGALNYRFIHIEGTWGKSHSVAVIDDYYGSAVGYLYPSDYPDQTFSPLSSSQVSAATLSNYDTVILFMFNPTLLATTQKAAVNDWIYKGGKLIIWDSDQVPPGSPWDYTWLPYPFTTSVPGQTGQTGEGLNILEENQLSSSDPSSPYYIDTAVLNSQTDAVGDANVLISYSPGWRIDMMAKNVLGETGPAHVYAAYGSGLLIYSALDWDYAGGGMSGGQWLKKLLKQELECSYLPFVAPPVLGEVGLTVEVAPEAPEGYFTDKSLNFKVTVTNPTDQTGINIIAYNVELNVIAPEEIEIDTTTATAGNIAPGESKIVTFSGNMKKTGENIEVIVNARGEDRILWKTIAGSESCFISVHDPETPKADWSFAIITDLHIGYGRGLQLADSDSDGYQVEIDYGGFGWADSELLPQEGNYEITKCLASAIDKIITEKDYYNIKFVVVLGDISDTAEKSEFFKARELLNRLNAHGIPYIPLIGNHDVWPYTQDTGKHGVLPISESGSNDRSHYADIASYAKGDEFFKEVFWGESNDANKELIGNLFGDSWTYSYDEVVHIKGGLLEGCVYDFPEQDKEGNKYHDSWNGHKDCLSREHDFYLQNYGFTYDGITFVCLDLAPRLGEDRDPGDGNAIPGSWKGGFATSYPETQKFSKDYFGNHPSSKKTAVLFSHYPLGNGIFDYVNPLPENYVQDYGEIFNFYGHIHNTFSDSRNFFWYYPDFSQGENILVHYVDTEDVANIEFSVGTEPKQHTGNPVRIATVEGDSIDFSTLLAPTEKVDIQWRYPDFVCTHASYPQPNKEMIFTAYYTSYHGFKTSFDWDFGDGSFGSGSSVKHSYAQESVYNVSLAVTTKNLITGEEANQTVTESVYVHSKHVISPLPSDLYATSLLTGEDLTRVSQNTYEPVLTAKEGSEERPIALLGAHFEEATQDIDLSSLVADINVEKGKSVIYMPTWPKEIDQYKQLFIPSTGARTVYICLDATSLDDVSLENVDVILNVGETKDGITVTTTFYNGTEYYLVSGVTGTGGGELKDTIPPTTTLTVGEPKYVAEITYVTPDTPFSLQATDTGSGVSTTAYQIYSGTYNSDWLIYTGPFRLSSLVYGNCTIVFNSTDNAGNVENTNYINVTLVGPDVNGDGKVDIFDAVMASNAFGSYPGHPRWNPIVDVNFDEQVDIYDLILVARMFGKHYP